LHFYVISSSNSLAQKKPVVGDRPFQNELVGFAAALLQRALT